MGQIQETDEDIQLAMALSASIAANNGGAKIIKNENVELQMEIKDDCKRQAVMPQYDMLDLMSMTLPNNKKDESNSNNDDDIKVDENDPFSSLIIEYKQDKAPKVETAEIELKSAENQEVDIDFLKLIDGGNIESVTYPDQFNPLLSHDPRTGQQMAQNMEDDLWRVLENSMTET